MKVATAGSRTSKRWQTLDVTWDWMLNKLRNCKRTGETVAEYKRMTHEEQAARKDVGGFVGGALDGPRRTAGAVVSRSMITLDADRDANLEDLENYFTLYGVEAVAYSTHSHTAESPRLRYIIPMTRPVSREEYGAVARKVAEHINIESMDPTTYQPERLMYWPSAPDDGAVVFQRFDGNGCFLDPDSVLAEYGPADAWKDVWRWPISSRETEIVQHEIKKAGDPTAKPGIVGKFCRTYDVEDAIAEFLPDVYVPFDSTGKHRYTYAAGSSAGGAVVEQDGQFLYSHHATDPASCQLCNAFDLVRIHKFGIQDDGQEQQEITRRPSYKAMCDFAVADPKVRELSMQEKLAEEAIAFGDLTEQADADTLEWTTKLQLHPKTGECEPTIENAVLILRNDPRIKGAIAKNEFSGRIVVRKNLPWRQKDTRSLAGDDVWTDEDDSQLMRWFEVTWQLTGETKIRHAFAVTVQENRFHPVREYLLGLPAWDGVERLDTMLVRWLGAENTRYTRSATRKWMSAAVARILNPGVKFDQMLVLVGPQGSGKSSLPRILSRGWCSDSITDVSKGKETYQELNGAWIIEIAELAATRKVEYNAVKTFISKQEDVYRPAYGRNVVVKPRECIFIGTTNDLEFLRDPTGGRRFWPIPVTGIEHGTLKGFADEVDLLWAEALFRYRNGEGLWFNESEDYAAAVQMQQEFAVQDELYGMVLDYLDIPLPEGWADISLPDRRRWLEGDYFGLPDPETCNVHVRQTVCISEVRCELCGEDPQKGGGNDSLSRHIGTILNNLPGWTRQGRQRYKLYGQQRFYQRD